MTEKVNAGTDIEKEVAERLRLLRVALQALRLEVPDDVAREVSQVAECYIESSRAALLAEVTERKRVEARLNALIKQIAGAEAKRATTPKDL